MLVRVTQTTTATATVEDRPESPLARTRRRLGLSQEQMAKLLGSSFVSVNRWEGGRHKARQSILDLYATIDQALAIGCPPNAIVEASNGERSQFLTRLYAMAYGPRPAAAVEEPPTPKLAQRAYNKKKR